MLRPALAASLGAAFGAIVTAPVTQAFQDALAPAPQACGIGAVALAAGLLGIPVMACRAPVRVVGEPLMLAIVRTAKARKRT